MLEFMQRLLRPVFRKADLAREIAGPTVTGMRQAISDHPARDITPVRLALLLRQAEEGDEIPYLELAEEMEEKDLHYRAVLATRKLQVAGLDLAVEAISDKPEDVEAADRCRELFPVIKPALFDIMDACGKGFSVSEIIWDLSGPVWKPCEIIWRDPRWFGFEPITGRGPYLRDEAGRLTGLAQAKFVVHKVRSKSGLPIRGGIARAAAWAWLFKNFDLKSWVVFCEVYGHPLRLGLYDENASEEQKAILLRAVRDIGADASAIVPRSMEVQFIDAKAQGNAGVFREFAEYLDMQISKLVLGQTGTTDTGSRVGTAEAHERVRADIERADADALAATLTRDVLTPFIRLNFGPERGVPVLRIRREEAEDLSKLAENLARLAPICPDLVEVSVIRDKFGWPEPAKGAVCIGRPDNADEVQVIEKVNGAAGLARQRAEAMPGLLAQEDGYDWIDGLADESLEGWVPLVRPLREQLEALASQCASYEEFLAGLAKLAAGLNVRELQEALAGGMFAAVHLARHGERNA